MADIKKNAGIMKGGLANKGRCPKCTLKPPCKHYESMDALNQAIMEASGLMPSASNPSGPTYGGST